MFRGMNYVYEVYKEKNFSRAAQKLFITQPALSNGIKRIEDKIGAPIFDRSTVPVQLTDVGEEYIRTVEKILEAEENFSHYLADIQELKKGKLTIGCEALYSACLLPFLIAPYQKQFPYIKVTIAEGTIDFLRKQLEDGLIDILIDNKEYPSDSLQREELQSEHILLAVPGAWELNNTLRHYQQSMDNIISGRYLKKQYPYVPLEIFKECPFLFPTPETDTYKRALNLCSLHGFEPNILLSVNQQLSSFYMTCEGVGISFISDTLIRNVLPSSDVIFYKLDELYAKRALFCCYKGNRYLPRALQEFLKSIREL